MRKHLLFLAALVGLAGSNAHAQTERGSTIIGLSASGLSYGRGGEFRQLSGTLTPTAGRFVADNLLLGLGVQVGHKSSRSAYPGYYQVPGTSLGGYGLAHSQQRWSVGVTPFARYYFLGRGRHRVFGEASVFVQQNWERERLQNDQGRLTSQQRFVSAGYRVGLGYSYFISPRTALEVGAGYLRSYAPGGSSGKLDARVGVSIFLPTGKR